MKEMSVLFMACGDELIRPNFRIGRCRQLAGKGEQPAYMSLHCALGLSSVHNGKEAIESKYSQKK